MILRLPCRYYCRYPYASPRGLVDVAEQLNTDRTAMVLVDVYGLGHDPGDPVPELPSLFLPRLHERQTDIIHERIRPALAAARASGLAVVYTENRWKRAAWSGSEFAALVDRVESGDAGSFDELYIGTAYNAYSQVITPEPADIVVEKTMYDGFYETTLDTVLRNLGVTHLVCVGFTADICLLNTVIGAMYRNYRVIVLRDCVLGAEFADTVDDLTMTRWAIRYYEAMVGFTSTSAEFVAACRAARASGEVESGT